MQVLDIVQASAFKSGVVSSFSRDDMPADVVDAGIQLLTNEILPALNCDRTIDITTTSRVYVPVNNTIVLKPLTQPNDEFIVIGYSQMSANELREHLPDNLANAYIAKEIERLEPTWVTRNDNNQIIRSNGWPVDDFGDYKFVAVWSSDNRLVFVNDVYHAQTYVKDGVNIDFPPMRIDAVMDVVTRLKYQYLYRDEFESYIPGGSPWPGVYTTEEYDNELIVLCKGPSTPKMLIMPVPIQITNQDNQHPGEIIAPPKFRKYLIDATAVSLAIVYGVSTVDAMKAEAAASYNLIKKNVPQPMHDVDVPLRIGQILHGRRRFTYEGF